MLRKGALRLGGPFKLKSGRESPYFINFAALIDGESLTVLKRVFASFIHMLMSERRLEWVDFLFGPAYKGITIAALACVGLNELYGVNVRYLYDRKEQKMYGDIPMESVIVGAGFLKPDSKILLVDDILTTGLTKYEIVKRLELLGRGRVVGVVVGVDRQELSDERVGAAEQISKKLGVKVYSILNALRIFQSIKDRLSEDEIRMWIEYYNKYGSVKLT